MAQAFAVIIFVAMFILIIYEKFERQNITLISGLATIAFVFGFGLKSTEAIWRTLNLQSVFSLGFWYQVSEGETAVTGINWATIFFIAGMMIMVEGMAEAGFFKWLCLELAKLAHYRALRIFLAFMVLSAFLAMFIDSITVILFLAAITVEIGRLLDFEPKYMILCEIFCANLGGSATMCGDPPNVIIGTSLGYTFVDFVENTGLIAGINLLLVIGYFLLFFGKRMKTKKVDRKTLGAMLDPKTAISDKKRFVLSTAIFMGAIILLISHARTGLTVAFIGIFVAIATLLAAGKVSGKILKRLDYKTLLFFVGLFIVVGGLEETGVLALLAQLIQRMSGGNAYVVIGIIMILSAVASAFVDNIPFSATMIPVIENLSLTQGMDLHVMAWALAIGTDVGGSSTPIGASANVVGVSIAAREGHPIGWGEYCKLMVPATVMACLTSLVYIYIRYL